jgi:hypothetical protein
MFNDKIIELTEVLKKSAVVNIADLISLYRTPPKERYEKNWTAFCKRFGFIENYSLKYLEKIKNYIEKKEMWINNSSYIKIE